MSGVPLRRNAARDIAMPAVMPVLTADCCSVIGASAGGQVGSGPLGWGMVEARRRGDDSVPTRRRRRGQPGQQLRDRPCEPWRQLRNACITIAITALRRLDCCTWLAVTFSTAANVVKTPSDRLAAGMPANKVSRTVREPLNRVRTASDSFFAASPSARRICSASACDVAAERRLAAS